MSEPGELATQIDEDGVAFVNPPVDADLERQLTEALPDGAGFIVAPPGFGPLRDLGQDVLDVSEAATIVVRSPESAAVVSDVHSRAAIESAQSHLFAHPDYVLGAREFFADLAGFNVPWALLTTFAGAALVILSLWSARSVRS